MTPSPFQPITDLLRNRILVTAVISAILAVAISLHPPLATYRDELLQVLVILVLTVFGGEVTAMLTSASVMKAQLQLETARVAAASFSHG